VPTEWFASLSHLLAAPVALVWGVRAMRRHRGTPGGPALALFTLATVVLLLTSGVYHILPRGTAARELMLRLDHAAIWLMIACSFHAIHELVFTGRWRWIPPALVWSFAVVGIVLIALAFESFSTMGWMLMYIAAGWIGVVSLVKLVAMRRLDVVLLFTLGGAVYTLGAIGDELWRFDPVLAVFGHHEIWHLAVLGGLVCHGALVEYLAQSPDLQRGSSAPQRMRTWMWVSWPSLCRTIGLSGPDQLGQRTTSRKRERSTPSARAAV
jgi:hemolysin III